VQCYEVNVSKFSVFPVESCGIYIRGDFVTLVLDAFKKTCALTSWVTQTSEVNQGVPHVPGELAGAIKQDCL